MYYYYSSCFVTLPTGVKLLLSTLSVPEKQRHNNKHLKPSRYLPNPSGIYVITAIISVIIIVACYNNCGGIPPVSLYLSEFWKALWHQ